MGWFDTQLCLVEPSGPIDTLVSNNGMGVESPLCSRLRLMVGQSWLGTV